ncbi:1-aminocyclopropane-1-carboxylate oxidase-like isoform X2 [Prosopis cineraria]|uniref:1-aminocyclopropane-1-carboxylate oxidase-like isoform X2 n=1 Tax=Prosopis cineraria TaxID=364024 RepID=UPI00240F8AFA|nr:1-aminocyclopropane-1-carboxylate oxidase-like isoform X2 [Prosopis cineraria]
MAVPTIDISAFLKQGDEDGKSKAIRQITEACCEYGFFQIMNHEVSLELMERCLDLSRTFFNSSDEEKQKSSPRFDGPLPAGYSRQPSHSPDKNEYLLVFPPGSDFNVYPQNPPRFREAMEEVFEELKKVGMLLEGIINECLGMPPDVLKEFNDDRSWDFMVALRYFPASESEDNGITEHEDGNCFSFVIPDQVGGLQVRHDGAWIPVVPTPGTIVFNIADVIQIGFDCVETWKVLSNEKFKSGTHRVVRTKGKSRYSLVFFYNLHGDKWVEPLAQFTKEAGEAPKYRGFVYKDYQQLRVRNKTHPPPCPQDAINISHYAITH